MIDQPMNATVIDAETQNTIGSKGLSTGLSVMSFPPFAVYQFGRGKNSIQPPQKQLSGHPEKTIFKFNGY
jgi:hypothetical protein